MIVWRYRASCTVYHDNYHKHKGSSKLWFKGSCALLQCFSDERKAKNDCLMIACDTDSSWLLEAGRREGQPSSLCLDYSQPDCIGTRRTQSIWVLFLILFPSFCWPEHCISILGQYWFNLVWTWPYKISVPWRGLDGRVQFRSQPNEKDFSSVELWKPSNSRHFIPLAEPCPAAYHCQKSIPQSSKGFLIFHSKQVSHQVGWQ